MRQGTTAVPLGRFLFISWQFWIVVAARLTLRSHEAEEGREPLSPVVDQIVLGEELDELVQRDAASSSSSTSTILSDSTPCTTTEGPLLLLIVVGRFGHHLRIDSLYDMILDHLLAHVLLRIRIWRLNHLPGKRGEKADPMLSDRRREADLGVADIEGSSGGAYCRSRRAGRWRRVAWLHAMEASRLDRRDGVCGRTRRLRCEPRI